MKKKQQQIAIDAEEDAYRKEQAKQEYNQKKMNEDNARRDKEEKERKINKEQQQIRKQKQINDNKNLIDFGEYQLLSEIEQHRLQEFINGSNHDSFLDGDQENLVMIQPDETNKKILNVYKNYLNMLSKLYLTYDDEE